MPIWIALVAAVVGTAAVIFTVRAIRHRFAHRARVDAFAMLEATTGGRRDASTLTVAHPSGEEIEIWIPLEHTATPRVQIAIRLGKRASVPSTDYRSPPERRPIAGRPHLRLRCETWIDRIARGLHLNRELQTGDTEFDREVYVDSDAPDEDVHAILGDKRVRDAARLALACGFSEVEIGGKRNHLAAWARSPRSEHLVPETISAVSDALAAAAPCLPRFISARIRRTPRAKQAELIVVLVGMATVFLLVIAFYTFRLPAAIGGSPIDEAVYHAGWIGGAVAALLFSAIAAWLVRGTSHSLGTALFCGGFLLVGIPINARTFVVLSNSLLDRSTPTVHRVRVLEHKYWKGRGSGQNAVRVESWRPHERYLDLVLPTSAPYRFYNDNDVSIATRPGAFGWEYIVSVEPIFDRSQFFKQKPLPDEIAP